MYMVCVIRMGFLGGAVVATVVPAGPPPVVPLLRTLSIQL